MKNLWNKLMSNKKLLWGGVAGVVCLCLVLGMVLLGGGNGGQGGESSGDAQLGGNTTESTLPGESTPKPGADTQPGESTGAETNPGEESTVPSGDTQPEDSSEPEEPTDPAEPTENTEPVVTVPPVTEPAPTEPVVDNNDTLPDEGDRLPSVTETVPDWVENLNCTYEDVTPETVWVVYTGLDIMKRPDGRYFGDAILAEPTVGMELKRTGIGTNDARGLSRVEYNGKVGYIRSCVLVTAKPSAYSTEERTIWLDNAPLYYTYPDGSVHTEPVNGATWIDWDGEKQTCVIVVDERTTAEICGTDGYCGNCGRHPGDGANDTCLRYVGGGDHTCPHCGVVFAENTCHTCGVEYNGNRVDDNGKLVFYCSECGKILGDGSNGTCHRYIGGGDHICANCGEVIPEKTCHTCKED